MSRGVLAAVAAIIFIYAWNQYLWPAVVIETERNQVAQVGLNQLGGGPIAMPGQYSPSCRRWWSWSCSTERS